MALGRKLRERGASFSLAREGPNSLQSVMSQLAVGMIQRVNFKCCFPATIVEVLDFYVEVGQEDRCPDVLTQLLEVDRGLSGCDYITNKLLPFVTAIAKFVRDRGIPAFTLPYATFFKAAVDAWCKRILGAKPTKAAAEFQVTLKSLVDCCDHCRSIAASMNGGRKQTIFLPKVGTEVAGHVDAQMKSSCKPSVASGTITRSSPAGFMVSPLNSSAAFKG